MSKKNVDNEFELYLPMKNWLQGYLEHYTRDIQLLLLMLIQKD